MVFPTREQALSEVDRKRRFAHILCDSLADSGPHHERVCRRGVSLRHFVTLHRALAIDYAHACRRPTAQQRIINHFSVQMQLEGIRLATLSQTARRGLNSPAARHSRLEAGSI